MPNQFQTQSVEASEKTDAERRIEDVAVETTAANWSKRLKKRITKLQFNVYATIIANPVF